MVSKNTCDKLRDKILRFVDNPKGGISTFEIVNWAKTHPHVSVHTFHPRYKKFNHNVPDRPRTMLCYIQFSLKKATTIANKGGAKDILKNLVQLKWS